MQHNRMMHESGWRSGVLAEDGEVWHALRLPFGAATPIDRDSDIATRKLQWSWVEGALWLSPDIDLFSAPPAPPPPPRPATISSSIHPHTMTPSPPYRDHIPLTPHLPYRTYSEKSSPPATDKNASGPPSDNYHAALDHSHLTNRRPPTIGGSNGLPPQQRSNRKQEIQNDFRHLATIGFTSLVMGT